MANSSNALWIGGIVIVAALTVVELTSSRNDDVSKEITNSGTAADVSAPVSSQQDTGRLAMGTTEPVEAAATMDPENEFEYEDSTDESFTGFDLESEFSSNLIIDLDNPEADVAALTYDLEKRRNDDGVEINNVVETDSTPAHTPVSETAATENADTEITQSAQTEIATLQSSETATAAAEVPQSTTPRAPFSSEDVSRHLAAAEKALKAFHMTTPVGDNAYEHYQAVLAIDPDNTDARAGIQKMVDMYVHLIEKAIADDQLNRARVYLHRAEDLQTGATKLQNLRAELY